MRRRDFVTMLGGAAASWPIVLHAQQGAGKLPRIGFLIGIRTELDIALATGLREAGHIDGQNVVLETRLYGTALDRIDELASELAALKCSVIFAANPYAIRALRKATSTIPIVGVDFEDDPVANGWAQSLAHPAGNITGLFLDIPELAGKLIEFLTDAVPTLSHLAALWDETIGKVQFRATEQAAHRAGIRLTSLAIQHVEDINQRLEHAARERVDGLVVLSSPLVFNQRSQIVNFALKSQLPTISLFTSFPRIGGLMAYGPDLASMWMRAASYIDRILSGAKVGQLPIERPSKFELLINTKTANALGLTVPESLLARANEVIE